MIIYYSGNAEPWSCDPLHFIRGKKVRIMPTYQYVKEAIASQEIRFRLLCEERGGKYSPRKKGK